MEFDAVYDLVIVGSGASGKSAAYVAAQAGMDVVILEKMPETGGLSMYAEGTGAFESAVQKKLGTPPPPGFGGSGWEESTPNPNRHFPSKEEGYAKFAHYSHGRSDTDVVKAFVDHSAEAIDMLIDLGINYLTVTVPGDDPNDLITGHIPEGAVARCQEVLLSAIQNLGVDIFCSTSAKKLLSDESGRVVGVLAVDADGNEMRVGGKAVILATGGMQCSAEKMAKYSWLGDAAYHLNALTPLQNVGEGMDMALEVGADPAGCYTAPLCFFGARDKTADSHMGAAGMQPSALWVNKGGYRFAPEDAIWGNQVGNIVARQPDGTSYTILDSAAFDRLVNEGSEIPLGAFVVIGKPLAHLQAEFDTDFEAGKSWRADTVEGLAQSMGVDPSMLAQTVADYNAACEAGVDSRYGKNPKYLRALTKAPFYAIEMGIGIMGSTGGIRINGNMQVVDALRHPIPGLYAVGLDATGLFGDTYNMEVGGSCNGFAHTSGRLAAQHFLSALEN